VKTYQHQSPFIGRHRSRDRLLPPTTSMVHRAPGSFSIRWAGYEDSSSEYGIAGLPNSRGQGRFSALQVPREIVIRVRCGKWKRQTFRESAHAVLRTRRARSRAWDPVWRTAIPKTEPPERRCRYGRDQGGVRVGDPKQIISSQAAPTTEDSTDGAPLAAASDSRGTSLSCRAPGPSIEDEGGGSADVPRADEAEP